MSDICFAAKHARTSVDEWPISELGKHKSQLERQLTVVNTAQHAHSARYWRDIAMTNVKTTKLRNPGIHRSKVAAEITQRYTMFAHPCIQEVACDVFTFPHTWQTFQQLVQVLPFFR